MKISAQRFAAFAMLLCPRIFAQELAPLISPGSAVREADLTARFPNRGGEPYCHARLAE